MERPPRYSETRGAQGEVCCQRDDEAENDLVAIGVPPTQRRVGGAAGFGDALRRCGHPHAAEGDQVGLRGDGEIDAVRNLLRHLNHNNDLLLLLLLFLLIRMPPSIINLQ